MRQGKALGTALVALAIALSAMFSYPVAAATPGFHAAYFSESAFLALQVGQTGQFSVGFSNTGDQAWIKSITGSSLSLHTAAPLDNADDFNAGWAAGQDWTAPNIYAKQLSDLVAPGQIGFFVYNVKVPTGAALGAHTFYGRPVIDGVSPLEDYGYFQVATIVSSAFTLAITSTNPASPSISSTPNIIGSGAPPSTAVQIKEGSTVYGTGTSQADGSFTISLTTALSIGSHSLVASAIGGTDSAAFTYTVSTSSTTTPSTSSGSLSVSRPGNGSIIVTFPRAVNSSSVTAANFKFDSANFPSAPTLQTGGRAVRLDFLQNALPATGTHSLDIYSITYVDNTLYSPNPTTFSVVQTADTTLPTLSSASAVAANIIDVTFSEAMQTTAYFSSTNAINNTARYTLNNPDGSAATTGGTSGSGAALTVSAVSTGGTSSDTALFNETKARVTFSGNLNPGTNYTIIAASVADQTGNILTSGSAAASFSSSSVLPTLTSISATQRDMTASYSKAMARSSSTPTCDVSLAACQNTATTCPTGTNTQIDTTSNYVMGDAMNTAMANSGTKCVISVDERTVMFLFTAAVGYPQGTYTYSVSGVSDNVSTANLIATNPSAGNVVASNSAPRLASASYVSTNSFSVTFSETISTSSTVDAGSGTNPANYSVSGGTGGTGVGTFGDLCSTGTVTASTSDSKTFTIGCGTGGVGRWGTSGTALSVRRVIDADSSAFINPDPSAAAF